MRNHIRIRRGHERVGEEWLPSGGGLAQARVQGVLTYEVAGALAAGCRTLLSEDLQHEQRIENLTVTDPFR